jgi:30S ribosomal protein S31
LKVLAALCFSVFPLLLLPRKSFLNMGKGDKKTKKGKIAIGSYGNSRKRSHKMKKRAAAKKAAEPVGTEAPAKPRKTARKKSEA